MLKDIIIIAAFVALLVSFWAYIKIRDNKRKNRVTIIGREKGTPVPYDLYFYTVEIAPDGKFKIIGKVDKAAEKLQENFYSGFATDTISNYAAPDMTLANETIEKIIDAEIVLAPNALSFTPEIQKIEINPGTGQMRLFIIVHPAFSKGDASGLGLKPTDNTGK